MAHYGEGRPAISVPLHALDDYQPCPRSWRCRPWRSPPPAGCLPAWSSGLALSAVTLAQDSTWRLVKRDLPNGAVLTPPDAYGMSSTRNGINELVVLARSRRRVWQPTNAYLRRNFMTASSVRGSMQKHVTAWSGL
jgi:hypothetical protein